MTNMMFHNNVVYWWLCSITWSSDGPTFSNSRGDFKVCFRTVWQMCNFEELLENTFPDHLVSITKSTNSEWFSEYQYEKSNVQET